MAKARIGGRVTYLRKGQTYTRTTRNGQTQVWTGTGWRNATVINGGQNIPLHTATTSAAPAQQNDDDDDDKTVTPVQTSGTPNQNAQIVSTGNYQPLTDAEASTIRQNYNSSYDPSTQIAIKGYISNTNYDGQGHSMSQSLNYKLDNGMPLDVNESYTDAYMHSAMHPIGKDVILQRGAHDDILKAMGIPNYTKMSLPQLQKAIIGAEMDTKSYMSVSYDINRNPFLSSSSSVSGGREVVLEVRAKATTNMLFGAKAQSELILDKNTHMKFLDVQYTGITVSPRSGGNRPQIKITVEVG